MNDKPENALARAGYKRDTSSEGTMQEERQWYGTHVSREPTVANLLISTR